MVIEVERLKLCEKHWKEMLEIKKFVREFQALDPFSEGVSREMRRQQGIPKPDTRGKISL